MIFQEESGDKETEPSYLWYAELDDETIGKALSSPLFIQEREEPVNRRQTYDSFEEGIPTSLLGVGSVCGLGPDLVGIHSVSLAVRFRAAACSTTLNQGLEKIQAARGCNFAPIFAVSLLTGRKKFLHLPWLVAPRTLSILFVAWTMMVNLMKLHRIRSRRLPLDYSVTDYMSRILLDLSPYGPPKFWDQSAVIELQTSCTT